MKTRDDGSGSQGGEGMTGSSARGAVEIRLSPMRLALLVGCVAFLVAAYVVFRKPAGSGPAVAGHPGVAGAPGPIRDEDVSKDVSLFDRGDEGTGRGGGATEGGQAGKGLPRAAPPASSAPPSVPAGWTVQVFSGDASGAEDVRTRLASRGWPVRVEPGGEGRIRVRVGTWAAREEAERAAHRIASTEKLEPWVVSTRP